MSYFIHCFLLAVLLFDTVRCTFTADQLCPSKKVDANDGLIIDVKASVAYGAKVLGGTFVDSTETCMSNCCDMEGCDLALYKKEGKSASGKNCYYLQCGVLANCKMVRHEGFVSVVMADNGQESFQDVGKESAAATVSPPATHAPDLKPSIPAVVTTPSGAESSTSGVTHVVTQPLPSDVKPSQHAGPQATVLPGSSFAEASGNQPHVMSTAATTLDDCERDGCAGVGAIVTATVGAIGLLLVVVVTLVIMKRTYDLHKRRKFTNVDYLINGMYA